MGFNVPASVNPPLDPSKSTSSNIYQVVKGERRARKARYRKKHAAVFNPAKPALDDLPNDVLLVVFKHLDVPSRICLGVSSKFFAEMSTMVNTSLTDQPTVVRFHESCQKLPCMFVNHISDRRILMLELKTWMPRNYRLCWVCVKYTRIDMSQWHTTTRQHFWGFGRLNLHAIDQAPTRKLYCHHECKSTGNILAKWMWNHPGASGGFDRCVIVPEPTGDVHVYNAGF